MRNTFSLSMAKCHFSRCWRVFCLLFLLSTCGVAQLELGICSSEKYPTSNRTPLFDGSLESAKPLTGEMLERLDSGAELFGCVCRKDLSAADITAYLNSVNPFNPPGDSDCLRNCQEAEQRFGYPEDSDSFLTTIFNVSTNGKVLAYTIIDETITVERPNLRFNLAFDDPSPTFFTFRVFYRVGGRPGAEVMIFDGLQDNKVNTTDCGTTKWARYTIPLESVLTSPEFGAVNASLDGSVITLLVVLNLATYAAIDNVELVGPPLTNESLADLLQVQTVVTSLPNVEVSVLGATPLDAFVSVFIFLAFVLSVITTTFVLWRPESRARAVRIITSVWGVLGLVISIYALFEYVDFLGDLATLDEQSRNITREVQTIVRSSGFDSRQLPQVTNGTSVYGAFVLPLPRFEMEALQRVFVFEDGLINSCVNTRVTGQQCVDSVDEFFNVLNTSKIRSTLAPPIEALVVEGTVSTSQDHFLAALLASLIGDLVVGGVLLFVSWRNTDESEKVIRIQRVLEGTITIFNLAIIVFLLVVATTEPIRFTAEINLVDPETGVGLHVLPRQELLRTSSTGSFSLDSKGLGVSERCIPDSPDPNQVQETLFQVYRIGLFDTITRELAPSTVGTNLQTCDWSNLVTVSLPDNSACSTVDCSQGILSFVREEAVSPLFNFVQTRIIFGVILIDFFISLIDIIVMLQVCVALRSDIESTQILRDK